jgi:hypothetical protein
MRQLGQATPQNRVLGKGKEQQSQACWDLEGEGQGWSGCDCLCLIDEDESGLTSVIPATQEAEIWRIEVQGWRRAKT